MKKFLLAALVLMLGLGAQAQIVSSHSKVKYKEKKERKLAWVIRAGVNISSLDGEDGNIYCEPGATAASYNVSFGFNLPISKEGVYFGSELGLTSNGTMHAKGSSSYKYHAIDLSPYLGWKYYFNKNIGIDVHAGAFLDVIYAGIDEGHYRYYDYYDYYYEYFYTNKFDAGLAFGAGVWFKKFNIDFSYKIGLANVAEGYEYDNRYNYDYSYKSRTFMVRLGYAF